MKPAFGDDIDCDDFNNLLTLVELAGRLNDSNNIINNIQRLEELCRNLIRWNAEEQRTSFISRLNEIICVQRSVNHPEQIDAARRKVGAA